VKIDPCENAIKGQAHDSYPTFISTDLSSPLNECETHMLEAFGGDLAHKLLGMMIKHNYT
jgi:hypothetical protein